MNTIRRLANTPRPPQAPAPLAPEQRAALDARRAAVEAEHHAEHALHAARTHRGATYRQLIAAMRQKEDPR